MKDTEKGLILNFTGNGKGKTSAALGIALRALGWDWRVAVVQFVKGPRETGEMRFFHKYFPGMIFEQHGIGRTNQPGDHAAAARACWKRAEELLKDFDGELLILDELNIALSHGMVGAEEVSRALKEKRPGLHVVITGRHAPEDALNLCDLVSEIGEVRHPYRNGVPALKGLDF